MKTPLVIRSHDHIDDADGWNIGVLSCDDDDRKEIVHRCNAYDALKELANEVMRGSDPSTGRQISDVTMRENEPLVVLAKAALAMTEAK